MGFRPLAHHGNFKSKRIWLSDAEDERLRREEDGGGGVLLSAVPKVKPQRGTEIKKKKKKKNSNLKLGWWVGERVGGAEDPELLIQSQLGSYFHSYVQLASFGEKAENSITQAGIATVNQWAGLGKGPAVKCLHLFLKTFF